MENRESTNYKIKVTDVLYYQHSALFTLEGNSVQSLSLPRPNNPFNYIQPKFQSTIETDAVGYLISSNTSQIDQHLCPDLLLISDGFLLCSTITPSGIAIVSQAVYENQTKIIKELHLTMFRITEPDPTREFKGFSFLISNSTKTT